jgi:small subunit ribosomal protein S20
LPQRKAGVKDLRQNRRRQMHNLDIKTDLRKTIKKFLSSIETKNASEAQSNLKLVYRKLDKAVKRNILKKNTVSRRKSRFAKLLKSTSS